MDNSQLKQWSEHIRRAIEEQNGPEIGVLLKSMRNDWTMATGLHTSDFIKPFKIKCRAFEHWMNGRVYFLKLQQLLPELELMIQQTPTLEIRPSPQSIPTLAQFIVRLEKTFVMSIELEQFSLCDQLRRSIYGIAD